MLPLTTRWPGNSWNKRLWNLLCANFQGHVIKESAGLGSKPATRLGSVLYCSLSVNFFPHRKKFHSTHSRNTSKLKRFSSCPSKKFFSATFGKKYILGKKRKEQTSVYYLVTIRLSPGLGGKEAKGEQNKRQNSFPLSSPHWQGAYASQSLFKAISSEKYELSKHRGPPRASPGSKKANGIPTGERRPWRLGYQEARPWLLTSRI